MLRNLESTGGLIFSGQLLLDLAESGMSREDAYRLVQSHAMRAWREELVFRDLVAQDPEITARLSPEKLARTFDLERQLGNVDAIFDRVLKYETVACDERHRRGDRSERRRYWRSSFCGALEADARVSGVDFVASEGSLRVSRRSCISPAAMSWWRSCSAQPAKKTHAHAEQDIGASIASGSYPSAGMIVLPCSMGTLAGIANGMAAT